MTWCCSATLLWLTSPPLRRSCGCSGASGLQVNYAKSLATLLNCDAKAANMITGTLGCLVAELPLTYLGIPLTIRRSTRAQMLLLVE